MPKPFGAVYTVAKNVARIPVAALTKHHWSGGENLPLSGGFILAPNHISEFDSMTFQHFMVGHNYPVRILCKEELFKVPLLGWVFKATKQIPVYRQSSHSADALISAKRALQAGECVVIYPEGTLSRDADFWPMRGKTGAARLALQTRMPLIPVVQWGAQDVLDRYVRKPDLKRKEVWVKALPALDLSDLYEQADQPDAWREATDRIIRALHEGVAQLRGQNAPFQPIDPKDPASATKKELRLAHQLWRKQHPKELPSRRPLGQFQAYLDQARQFLSAQKQETAGQDGIVSQDGTERQDRDSAQDGAVAHNDTAGPGNTAAGHGTTGQSDPADLNSKTDLD